MRNLASPFFLTFLLLGQTGMALAADTEKTLIVDSRGFPGDRKEDEMYSALYAAEEGTVYVGLCMEGGTAQFYSYDPRTNQMRHLADMGEFLAQRGRGIRAAGKIHTKLVEDRQGRIYFATMNEDAGPDNIDPYSWEGPNWVRYDPKTGQLENLGMINPLWGLYGLAIDVNRNRLFGTAWNGHLYRFDIDTRKTVDLGRVDNWDDPRSIATDDQGNVYGPACMSRIWKYDAGSEKVYDLTSVRTPRDPMSYPTSLTNPMLDRKDSWRVVQWDPVDRVIYGVECGSSFLFRYDPHDGPEGKVTLLSKVCAERYYASGRKDIPYSMLSFTVGKGRKLYYAPVGMDFDYSARFEEAKKQARGAVNTRPSSELIVYDLKSATRTNLGTLMTRDGNHVYGCGGATAGPDGTIYLCCAVEEKDPQKAAGVVGGSYPFVMKILIYKPS